MNKITITEQEKNKILGLYGLISEGIRNSFDLDDFISEQSSKNVLYNVWAGDNYLNIELYPKQQNVSYMVITPGNCNSTNKNNKGMLFTDFIKSIKGKSPKLYEISGYKDSEDAYLKLKPKKVAKSTGVLSYGKIEDDGSAIFIRSWGACVGQQGSTADRTGGGGVKNKFNSNNYTIDDFLSEALSKTIKTGQELEFVYYVKLEGTKLILSKDEKGTSDVISIEGNISCNWQYSSTQKRQPGMYTIKELAKMLPGLGGEYKITIPKAQSLKPTNVNYAYMAMTPTKGGQVIYVQSECVSMALL